MENKDAVALKMLHALEDAIPLLVQLGDFIGNGMLNKNRKESLGVRCDAIDDIREAIAAGREAFQLGAIPGGQHIDPLSIPPAPSEAA